MECWRNPLRAADPLVDGRSEELVGSGSASGTKQPFADVPFRSAGGRTAEAADPLSSLRSLSPEKSEWAGKTIKGVRIVMPPPDESALRLVAHDHHEIGVVSRFGADRFIGNDPRRSPPYELPNASGGLVRE